MRLRLFIVVVLGVFWAFSARAQNGPDNDPVGLQGLVGGPFASSEPDSINLFNGQLAIPVAVGPSYPIGPNLRFQALLTYNSRVWELGHHTPTQDEDFSYTPVAGNPALGIGWNFSLGAVKLCTRTSLYCYVGPDGGQHIFDEPDNARGAGFFKSSDGSRLSLKNAGANGFEMWDEAGNHYVFDTTGHVSGYDDSFTNFTHDFGRGRDGWYLTKLEDPFHNSFTVTYYANTAGDSKSPCWAYEGAPSSAGRMQCPDYQVAPRSWIPSRITVPKGLGSTQDIRIDVDASSMISGLEFPVSGGGTAVWTLGYGTTQCYQNPSSGTIDLRTIASINFPPGIGGNPSYAFSYYKDNSTNTCPGGSCPTSGLLQQATLPTGATVAYQYRPYNFYHTRVARFGPGCTVVIVPDGQTIAGSDLVACAGQSKVTPRLPIEPCDPSFVGAFLDDITLGVGKRTLTVGGVAAITDYFQYSFPYGEYGTGPSPNNCDQIGRCGAQSMTIVVYPEVDLNGGAAGTGRRVSRAVLFSVDSTGQAGGTEGAPIEERVFDGDASIPESSAAHEPVCGPNASPEQPFCPDRASRVTRRTFEYGDDVSGGNRRLQSETTIYGTPDIQQQCFSCAYHSVNYSNLPGQAWDASGVLGNGRHYNIETHGGSLGNDGRTITTSWAPLINGSTYQPDRFTERKDVQGSSTRDQFFEFDATTGFPVGTFVWDQASQRVWLNCRFADGRGNVDKQLTRTFSSASAPFFSYCSTTYGSSMPSVGLDQDMFGQSYSYQNGEVLSANWLSGTGSIGWNRLTLSRDPSTGWVTSTADSAGVSTGYTYDSIGRMLGATPAGETGLSVAYPSPTQTIGQRNGGTGLTTYLESDYDGLGRLITQRRLMPQNQYVKRFLIYDGRGTPVFSSEWVPDSTPEALAFDSPTSCNFSGGTYSTRRPSAAPGSYSLCFDPFGRPQQTVGTRFSSLATADRSNGSSYYSDTREAVTAACVNGSLFTNGSCGSGGANAVTTFIRDAFGRLTSVTEPSNDTTRYAYDVNANLTCVKQGGTQDMTSCADNPGGQYRKFLFDSFGFLRQEITPEKGSVTYDTIGSLGNLRQATEQGNLITLRCYDSAGRLTSVRSNESGSPACGGTAGTLYSGFTYDQNPSFSNYSLGKLTQRQSFVSQLPMATDVFTYGGTGGRVSQQTTTVAGTPAITATQSWQYNNLGLVAQYNHPRAAGWAPFAVSTDYDAGLAVGEYVNGIPMVTGVTYQPSGSFATFRTGVRVLGTQLGQNVTTNIQQDGTVGRPASISASGGTSSFSTGSYGYDGTGNITAMGSDLFSYDNRSRLTQAYLSGVAGTNCQMYDYDTYGNLWRQRAGSWSGFCSVTSTTNLCGTGSCAGNRLDSGVATYDATGRGNLTANLAFGNERYTYDGLNRVSLNQFGTTSTNYYYDGSSERIAKVLGTTWTYNFRDERGRLVTEASGSAPFVDNLFLGNVLVASYTPGSASVWSFYAPDHLGTPRLITNLAGGTVETRRHWPYGGDVGTPSSLERLRFAEMERDLEGNHYYDHARNQDFNLGRFLTPDLLLGRSPMPQSWNRYSYVLGNPMLLVDPYGLRDNPVCILWNPTGNGEPPTEHCYVLNFGPGGSPPPVTGNGDDGGGISSPTKKPATKAPTRPCDIADRIYNATLGRIPEFSLGGTFAIPALAIADILGGGVDIDVSVNFKERSIGGYAGAGVVLGDSGRFKADPSMTLFSAPNPNFTPGWSTRIDFTAGNFQATAGSSGLNVSVTAPGGWSVSVTRGVEGSVTVTEPCKE